MSSTRRGQVRAALLAASILVAAIGQREAVIGWFLGSRPAAHAEGVRYTCAMDPSVVTGGPGACPICGMALTPVTAAERASDVIRLDAGDVQRIGVRFAAAERRRLVKRIVGFGEVVERKLEQKGVAQADGTGSARVDAVVYSDDASAVTAGQAVAVTSPALPLTSFGGSITLVRPDAEARTTQIEVVVEDPGLLLQPGMQAEVQIDVDLGERLVVPAKAVIHAGKKRIVFVDRGGGKLEPRPLRIGAQAGGLVEVESGLTEGERAIVSGNFLVAAESRIRSASTLWTEGPALVPTGRQKGSREDGQKPAGEPSGGRP